MRFWLTFAAVAACAPVVRVPPSVRDYDILVTGRDSLDEALVVALRETGITVRRQVRGGAEPTLVLIRLSASQPPPGTRLGWLEVQLVDTRRGATVAAALVLLDSLPPGVDEQARAIRDSLGLGSTGRSQDQRSQ